MKLLNLLKETSTKGNMVTPKRKMRDRKMPYQNSRVELRAWRMPQQSKDKLRRQTSTLRPPSRHHKIECCWRHTVTSLRHYPAATYWQEMKLWTCLSIERRGICSYTQTNTNSAGPLKAVVRWATYKADATVTASRCKLTTINLHYILFMVALWNRADHYIFMLWFVLSSYSSSFFPRLISAAADWMSAILPHMSLQYGELRPTSGSDRLTSLGHPCKFQLVSRLGSVTAWHPVVGVSQTLRRWTEGATDIRQGDHHVGHWPTSLVLSISRWAMRHGYGQYMALATALSALRRPLLFAQTLVSAILCSICMSVFIMVVLCNRADHYIFALWFLSSSIIFPRLISAVGDWMSTILPHMVWP